MSCLYIFVDHKCFINAQDYRRLKWTVLQNFDKQQTRTKLNAQESGNNIAYLPSTKITTNTALGNEGIKTYFAPQIALAVPIEDETVRKDKLRQKTTTRRENDRQKAFDLEKAQLWRFKLVQGTDKHLKQIFIGKCWDHQNRFKLLQKPVDCARLWEAFIAGFAYKEPCDVTLEDYKDFFEMIHEGPLVNRV